MFDIAWSELGVIAVVALIVIGPKDLPKVLRTIGQWTAKARSMAREFQSGIDDMVREIQHLIDQMDDAERRMYLAESLFLNTVKYENDKLEAYMKKLTKK